MEIIPATAPLDSMERSAIRISTNVLKQVLHVNMTASVLTPLDPSNADVPRDSQARGVKSTSTSVIPILA